MRAELMEPNSRQVLMVGEVQSDRKPQTTQTHTYTNTIVALLFIIWSCFPFFRSDSPESHQTSGDTVAPNQSLWPKSCLYSKRQVFRCLQCCIRHNTQASHKVNGDHKGKKLNGPQSVFPPIVDY